MIKKLKHLLTFIVIGLGITSFTNASTSFQYHYVGVASTVGSYDVTVETKGNFLTTINGVNKSLLDFGNGTYLFRTKNGDDLIVPYVYNVHGNLIQSQQSQGVIKYFYMCDELTDLSNDPTGCSLLYNTEEDNNILSDFLGTVTSEDYYGILPNGISRNIFLVISSKAKGKSIYIYTQLSGIFLENLTFPQYTFETIPSSILYNSPGYSGGGGGSGNSGITIQGPDVVLGCFNRDIKSYYERNGLTPNVCYGGINNLLSGNLQIPIAGTGLNYQEIYSGIDGKIGSYTGFSSASTGSWFSYWRSAYNNLNYVQTSTVFDNYPSVLYTYFNFVSTYGNNYSNNQIIDYCDIIISNDLNSPYTGYNSDFRCKNGVVLVAPGSSSNISGDNQSVIQGAWTGSIIGLLTGSNSSGDVEEVQDFGSFMTNWFDTFKDLYSGLDLESIAFGFLPTYIVAFMILLIVFRFFSH